MSYFSGEVPREQRSSKVMMPAANASRAIVCAASLRLSRVIQPTTAHPLERSDGLWFARSPARPCYRAATHPAVRRLPR